MTRTAKQRIEQAVERIYYPDYVGNPTVAYKDAVAMILAERARLKRGVKAKQRITVSQCSTSQFCAGYLEACADILKLWEA